MHNALRSYRFLLFPFAAAGLTALVAGCGGGDDDGGFVFVEGGNEAAVHEAGTDATGDGDGGVDMDMDANVDAGTDSGPARPDAGRDAAMLPLPTVTANTDPAMACSGSDVNIEWMTTNAQRVDLLESSGHPIIGILDRDQVAHGHFPVPVPMDGVVRVRATGPGGLAEQRLEITVQAGATITSFEAVPDALMVPAMTTLRWSTEHAVSVELTAMPGGAVTVPAGMVASGMLPQTLGTSTEYTLAAIGDCGERVTAHVRVTVFDRPPTVTFTVEDADLMTPVAGPTASLAWRHRARMRWTTLNAATVSLPGWDSYFDDGSPGAFEDISTTGTVSTASGDDAQQTDVPIGFSFDLFGTDVTTVTVTTNGFIATAAGSYASTGTSAIPDDSAPNGVIAPFWDDLRAPDGSIRYQTLGTAPNRRFVVQWTNVTPYTGTEMLTFQCVLFESGRVEYRYRTLSGYSSDSAAIGLESVGGDRGVALSVNRPGGASDGSGYGLALGSPLSGEIVFSPAMAGMAHLVATNPVGMQTGDVSWTIMTPMDTGCGPGTATVTLPAPDAMGLVHYAGNTSMGGSHELTSAMCFGSEAGPEIAHLLTVPYACDLEVRHATTGGFDAVLYARRQCANPASEVDCVDFTSDIVTMRDLSMGDTVGLIVDAYGTGMGAYTIDVTLHRRLAVGAACMPTDLCGGGTECIGGTCTMVPELHEPMGGFGGSPARATDVTGRTRVYGSLGTATERDCFAIDAPAGGSLLVGTRTTPDACSSNLAVSILPPVGDFVSVDGNRTDPYCDYGGADTGPAAGAHVACIRSLSGPVPGYILDLIPSTTPAP